MNKNAMTVRATALSTVRQRNRSRRVMGAAVSSSSPTSSRRMSAMLPRASRMADQPQGARASGCRMARTDSSSLGA